MSIGSSPFQGGGSASIADATESTAGKIRIATTSESTTGTNDTAAMTPAKVKARIDAALVGGVEYKGTFNATTGLTNSGGNLNNAEQGDLYVIDTAGTIYGATWAVGDHLLINADMGGSISNSKIDKVDNTESDTLDTVTGRGATTSNAVQVGGLNIAGSYALPTSDGSAGQILKTDGSGALTFQSLGSISTQAANNVNITGGAISGITDLAIADGGTGASTEAQARTNLGLAIGSDVQAHDAGLTSISGLTTAADKMLYTTGSDTYAVTSLTAAGRALLDDADAAAQRTTLGLAAVAASGAYSDLSGAPTVPTTLNTLTDVSISSVSNGQVISYNSTSGEWENSTPASGGASDLNGLSDVTITGAAAGNVLERNGAGQFINVAKSTIDVGDFNDDNTYQPKDAGLTSISGLTTAADKMIYTTGSDTYAVTSLTAAGRALLDDADAAAQRTTLGLVIGTDVLSDVVQDTSPQLGGNLDLNGQDIVTTSNANLELAPDGTGVVSIKGNTTGGSNQGALKLNCEQNSHFVQIKSPSHSLLSSGGSYTLTLPPDDGDANQVLKTDGSGVLDWVDQASGGGTIPDVVVTGNAGNVSAAFASAGSNGENERVYLINNSSTARTVTLPATSGNSGKKLQVKRLGTANVTIAVQSGETLETTTDGTFILSAQFSSVTLVCNASGTLDGWYII